MSMTLIRSALPFPDPRPGENRYLLIDGTLFPDRIRWFDSQGVTETCISVLTDGQYDALSGMGPLLMPVPDSSKLAELWAQPPNRLHSGVIIHATGSDQMLIQWLRARTQVRLADGRTVWFRLGDAKVLKRMLDNASLAPAHFWPGVSRISIGNSNGFYHYQTAHPHNVPTLADRVEPRFQFNTTLAAALGQGMAEQHTEVT